MARHTRRQSFLRHLIRNAAILAAFLLGVTATHLAAVLAFLWAGPLAGIVVYFIVIVALISAITYLTE